MKPIFGIAGEGAIELHDLENGYRRIPIAKGSYVQFPPWTLHRSVSTEALEVLALMGNQGLAERGDARIYFGSDVDEDPARYEDLKRVAENGLDGAIERRDHSSHAYMALMHLWKTDKDGYRAELRRFFDRHRQTIAAMPALSGAVIAEPGDAVSGVRRWSSDRSDVKLGMCGTLRQINVLEEA